jgi:uncharacterized protein (DUF2267 family)
MMQAMGTDDRRLAYTSLRAVMHALRDRLPVEEVAQFGAQLPMLIRGFYYEGWNPTGKPVTSRHKDEFLAWIEDELRTNLPIDAEFIARAAFKVIADNVTQGEIEDVEHIMPKELRELWPSSNVPV